LAVDIVLKEFEKSISGLYNSLDEMQEAYD
jgi:hypothetical protein